MGLSLSVEGGDPRWVAAAAHFAGDCANRLGLDGTLLEEATASACRNVTKHAYEAGEVIRYQVSVEEQDGTLVVGVTDQGLTFSLTSLENPVFQRLDSIRLYRLGKAGKRLELRQHLPERTVEELLTETDRTSVPEPPVSQAEVSVRAAVPGDAVGIARCIYRCYGRTYGSQYMYLPEKLKRMWEQGMLISVVAEAEGDIVGHLDYWMESAGDPAGQSTDAVVDPRFRGRHLFDQMKGLLVDVTRAAGKLGMISEAVTVHPFTQKGVLAAGGIETGLMLGDLPVDLQFKKIEDRLPARQSCMLCYLRLNPEPEREAFLPPQHREMLERIVARVGLQRRLQVDVAPVEGESELELHLDPGWQEAGLRLVRFGADAREVLKSQLHHVLASGYNYAYLELPLRPGIGEAVAGAQEAGFSFAGLVPEGWQGDLLRLHYLGNLEYDPKIATASDWGAEIRDYVVQCAR